MKFKEIFDIRLFLENYEGCGRVQLARLLADNKEYDYLVIADAKFGEDGTSFFSWWKLFSSILPEGWVGDWVVETEAYGNPNSENKVMVWVVRNTEESRSALSKVGPTGATEWYTYAYPEVGAYADMHIFPHCCGILVLDDTIDNMLDAVSSDGYFRASAPGNDLPYNTTVAIAIQFIKDSADDYAASFANSLECHKLDEGYMLFVHLINNSVGECEWT